MDPEVLVRLRQELGFRPGRDARRVERRIGPEAAASVVDDAEAVPVAALRGRLAAALREIDLLRGEMYALESRRRSEASGHEALGLAFDAPRWLLLEVRRAYRRRHHPDRYTGPARDDAERRFKEFEAQFSAILPSE